VKHLATLYDGHPAAETRYQKPGWWRNRFLAIHFFLMLPGCDNGNPSVGGMLCVISIACNRSLCW
jgi:hypothetical protein